jgi:hypothetical protein
MISVHLHCNAKHPNNQEARCSEAVEKMDELGRDATPASQRMMPMSGRCLDSVDGCFGFEPKQWPF